MIFPMLDLAAFLCTFGNIMHDCQLDAPATCMKMQMGHAGLNMLSKQLGCKVALMVY